MDKKAESLNNEFERSSLNLAIVGGGSECESLLEILHENPLPHLDIHVLGVCDINPQAQGVKLAKKMGIYTTDKFQDLFEIQDLDVVIELTGSREILLEMIRLRPKGLGTLEHNFSKLLRDLLLRERKLRSEQQQLLLEKMVADFLIRQANERIAILNPDFKIIEVNEAYLKAAG